MVNGAAAGCRLIQGCFDVARGQINEVKQCLHLAVRRRHRSHCGSSRPSWWGRCQQVRHFHERLPVWLTHFLGLPEGDTQAQHWCLAGLKEELTLWTSSSHLIPAPHLSTHTLLPHTLDCHTSSSHPSHTYSLPFIHTLSYTPFTHLFLTSFTHIPSSLEPPYIPSSQLLIHKHTFHTHTFLTHTFLTPPYTPSTHTHLLHNSLHFVFTYTFHTHTPYSLTCHS